MDSVDSSARSDRRSSFCVTLSFAETDGWMMVGRRAAPYASLTPRHRTMPIDTADRSAAVPVLRGVAPPASVRNRGCDTAGRPHRLLATDHAHAIGSRRKLNNVNVTLLRRSGYD